MRKILCTALLAGFAATAFVTSAAPAANAAVGISLNLGNVAIAYTDGYYDYHHHWHSWGPGEWYRYHRYHADRVHYWRHDDARHDHYRYDKGHHGHDWHHY